LGNNQPPKKHDGFSRDTNAHSFQEMELFPKLNNRTHSEGRSRLIAAVVLQQRWMVQISRLQAEKHLTILQLIT